MLNITKISTQSWQQEPLEIKDKQDLEQQKNQLVQILVSILGTEGESSLHILLYNLMDLIYQLEDCNPEKIKYALADYFTSEPFYASLQSLNLSRTYAFDFLYGLDLRELQEPVRMAVTLIWCNEVEGDCNQIQFSLNDLKYLAYNCVNPHRALSLMTQGNYIKKGSEFRELAITLIEVIEIKKNPEFLNNFRTTFLLIAETYAEEGNLELASQYANEAITNNSIYLYYRIRIHSIANAFFNNQNLSHEQKISIRSDFLTPLLPTPSLISTNQRDQENVSSSLLETIPEKLYDQILSFANTITLGNLAQTNVKAARKVYALEKEKILEILKFIALNSSALSPIVLEFDDLIDKVKTLPRCNLDEVKHIAIGYLSHLTLEDLWKFNREFKKYDFGRFQNIIELAQCIQQKEIMYVSKVSFVDLQFLIDSSFGTLAILKCLDINSLIPKGKKFRNLAVSLTESPIIKMSAKAFGNIFLAIALSYAEEGNLELTIKNTKAIISTIDDYLYYKGRIHVIANKIFKNEQPSIDEKIAFRSNFFAALLPTPSSLPLIRVVDSPSSLLESTPSELHHIILSFADGKALGNLAQTSTKNARRVYNIEKNHILELLEAIIMFILALQRNTKEMILEFRDLKNKLETIPDCNLDEVKYMAVRYLLGLFPYQLLQLKETLKQKHNLEKFRFKNLIELTSPVRDGLIYSETLNPSIADLQFLLDSNSCGKTDILTFLKKTNLIEETAFREFVDSLRESSV